jgi:SAM-dependent methyltransferase
MKPANHDPSVASLRYADDILAWEYDQRNHTFAPGEREWYGKYAALSGDPILELACGSGRLLLRLAEAGFQIDGVDNAAAMLRRLRNRISQSHHTRPKSIELHEADMAVFQYQRTYSLVLLGYNSVQYLATPPRLSACFRQAYDGLRTGGRFLLAIQCVDWTRYRQQARVETDLSKSPTVDEKTGLSVSSKFVSYLSSDQSSLLKERVYTIKEPGRPDRVLQTVTQSPVLEVENYVSLLREAGFEVSVEWDYGKTNSAKSGKWACLVGQKAAIIRDLR